MAARVAWRWLFWSTSIFQAVMMVVSFFTFKETYGPLILKRRAARLRRETGNQGYHVSTLDAGKSVSSVLMMALTRPLRLLLFHPIIQVSAVISAFNYGVLYIVLSTFSELWIFRYGQSVEISGLHYIACSLGELLGSQFSAHAMDFLFRRGKRHTSRPSSSSNTGTETINGNQNNNNNNEEEAPEKRLPLSFPGLVIAPLGTLWYGWAAQQRAHWAIVDAGVVVMMFGLQVGSMSRTAYVIDVYPEHASSAMAAQQFARSMTAFLFPLFAPAMYAALGYGWGNTAVALAGLVLGVPPLFYLWTCGGRLRARARSSY